MRAVVDTNVVLVANAAHGGVSPDCVLACIARLEALMKDGRVVIDDGYRIIGEYLHRTQPMRNKGVGDVFVRWLLKNSTNAQHVEQVALQETEADVFDEFPGEDLQYEVDPSDRKFFAVAVAHPERPPVWQAADCKWLDWWQRLAAEGVPVNFLCPDDVCRIYRRKFPKRQLPTLP